MVRQVFKGDTDQLNFSEVAFDVPNPAKQIRQEGLQTIQGWQQKSQYESVQAQEQLTSMRENARLEEQYRVQAFKLEQTNKKKVADALLHNKKVEIENIKTKASNEARKFQAIANILGATGQVVQTIDKLATQQADKKTAPLAIRANADGDVGPELKWISLLDKNSLPNVSDAQRLQNKEDAIAASKSGEHGLTEADINAIFDGEFSGFYRKASMVKAFAQLQKENTSSVLKTQGYAQQIHPIDPNDPSKGYVSMNTLVEGWKNVHGNDWHSKVRKEFNQAFDRIKVWYKGTFANTIINDKIYSDTIAPKVNEVQNKESILLRTPYDKVSSSKAMGEDYQSYLAVPYEGFRNSGLTEENAHGESYQLWRSKKPDNVSEKDWRNKYLALAISGRKSKKMSAHDFQKIGQMPIKIDGQGKTKTFAELYRTDWNHALRSTEHLRAEETQQLQDLTKAANARNNANWTLLSQDFDNLPENQRNAKGMMALIKQKGLTNNSFVMKKASALLNSDFSFQSLNAIEIKETRARMLAQNDPKYNSNWILSQPISWTQKNNWITELKNSGGSWPTKADGASYQYVNGDWSGIQTILKGEVKWPGGVGGIAEHYTHERALAVAQADYRSRVRSNFKDSEVDKLVAQGQMDAAWKLASEKALATFQKEWQDGLNGKGKYALGQVEEFGGKRVFTNFIVSGEEATESISGIKERWSKKGVDMFTDVNEPSNVSGSRLAKVVQGINNGGAIHYGQTLEELSRGTGLPISQILIGEVYKYNANRSEKMPEIKFNENTPYFKALELLNNNVELNQEVGIEQVPSPESTQILKKQVTEGPLTWGLNDLEGNPNISNVASYLHDILYPKYNRGLA